MVKGDRRGGAETKKKVFEFNAECELIHTWDTMMKAAEAKGLKTHFTISEALRKRRLYKGSYYSYDKLFVKRLQAF